MSNIKRIFGTNKKKEEEGAWVPGPDGTSYLIARANNERAEKLSKELIRPYRKLARMGQMPKDKQHEITLTVISRTILLDWRGIKDEKGQPIEYTPELGYKELDENPDFADFVAGHSNEGATFRDEEEQERRGNSSSASSGT